jgi:hypothetical protein
VPESGETYGDSGGVLFFCGESEYMYIYARLETRKLGNSETVQNGAGNQSQKLELLMRFERCGQLGLDISLF